jgi:hypothetical protein
LLIVSSMNFSPFHRLVNQVLRRMRIDVPAAPQGEAYRLTFDERTDLYLLSPRPGLLDLVAQAGVLDNRQAADVLLRLLALNCFHADSVPLNLGVVPDSGVVSLWMRLPLAETDADQTAEAIDRLLAGVDAARRVLERGKPHAGARGATGAGWLQARSGHDTRPA